MDGRDRIIDELRATVAKQTAQMEQTTARIAELELALAKAKKDPSTLAKLCTGTISGSLAEAVPWQEQLSSDIPTHRIVA